MSQKITGLLVMTMILTSLFATTVVAQDDSDIANESDLDLVELDLSDPGVEPDSALYGVDLALDRIRLILTRNAERRAEIALNIAEERLAEAEKLAGEGNEVAAERARLQHERALEVAENSLSTIEEIESASDEEIARSAWRRLITLQTRIDLHRERLTIARERLIENKAGNLTDQQLENLEDFFNRLEERIDEAENRALQREENLKRLYKAFFNKTDEELKEIEEGLNDEVREIHKERQARRAINRAEIRLNHVIELLEENGINDSEINSDIEEVKSRLQEAINLIEDDNFDEAREIANEVREFAHDIRVRLAQLSRENPDLREDIEEIRTRVDERREDRIRDGDIEIRRREEIRERIRSDSDNEDESDDNSSERN
jgi:hypothetical protein